MPPPLPPADEYASSPLARYTRVWCPTPPPSPQAPPPRPPPPPPTPASDAVCVVRERTSTSEPGARAATSPSGWLCSPRGEVQPGQSRCQVLTCFRSTRACSAIAASMREFVLSSSQLCPMLPSVRCTTALRASRSCRLRWLKCGVAAAAVPPREEEEDGWCCLDRRLRAPGAARMLERYDRVGWRTVLGRSGELPLQPRDCGAGTGRPGPEVAGRANCPPSMRRIRTGEPTSTPRVRGSIRMYCARSSPMSMLRAALAADPARSSAALSGFRELCVGRMRNGGGTRPERFGGFPGTQPPPGGPRAKRGDGHRRLRRQAAPEPAGSTGRPAARPAAGRF